MSGKEIVGRLKRFVDKLNGDNMTVDEAIAWAKNWPDTSEGVIEDSVAAIVLAKEVERLRAEREEVIKLGPHPVEQVDAMTLGDFVKTRFVPRWMFNSSVEELERLSKQCIENAKDADNLNEMLRQTGYGQGSIDAYAAQCEELDELKEENRNLAASCIPPVDFSEPTLEDDNHITLQCANKKDAAKMLRWLVNILKARIDSGRGDEN